LTQISAYCRVPLSASTNLLSNFSTLTNAQYWPRLPWKAKKGHHLKQRCFLSYIGFRVLLKKAKDMPENHCFDGLIEILFKGVQLLASKVESFHDI